MMLINFNGAWKYENVSSLTILYHITPNATLAHPSQSNCVKMNWTEGTLRRNSRGPGWNRDAVRRKQCFAKSRARQRHNKSSLETERQATVFIPDHVRIATDVMKDIDGNSKTIETSNIRHKRQMSPPIHTEATQTQIQNIDPAKLSKDSEGLDSVARLEDAVVDVPDNDETSLESKRRKLLGQKDWVGIESQKALLRGLAPPARIETTQQRHKGSHLIPKYSSNSSHRHCKLMAQSLGHNRPEGSMYLRIGSRDLKWNRENNSIKSPTARTSTPSSGWDWSSRKETSSSTREVPRAIPCTPSGMSTFDQEIKENLSWLQPRLLPFQQEDEQGTGQSLRADFEEMNSPRYVVRSPTPTLHHPRPSRHSQPAVINLRSPTSDAPWSVNARAGSLEKSPGCQDQADDRWRKWLQTSDELVSLVSSTKTADLEAAAGAVQQSASFLRSVESPLKHNRAALQPKEKGCRAGVSISTDRPVIQIQSQDASNQERGPGASIPVKEMDSLKDVEIVDGFSTTRRPGYQPPALTIKNTLEKTSLPENGYASTQQQARNDDEELWLRFTMCSKTDGLSQRAFEAAQNKTIQELCPSLEPTAEPIKSSIAEPPSPMREDTFVYVGDNNAYDLLSMTASAGFTDNTGEFSEDWTDLAHVQATRQYTSNAKQSSSAKFYQPQPFVGRLASMGDAVRPLPPKPPVKRGPGRPRREREADRPDFKKWPNFQFEEDPIDDTVGASDVAGILEVMS